QFDLHYAFQMYGFCQRGICRPWNVYSLTHLHFADLVDFIVGFYGFEVALWSWLYWFRSRPRVRNRTWYARKAIFDTGSESIAVPLRQTFITSPFADSGRRQ